MRPEAYFLDTLADFVGTALRTGGASIVIATKAHRDGLEERLQATGIDLAAARAAGRYQPLDAAETLSRFMVDGVPDPGCFAEVIAGMSVRAAGHGRPVSVFGEMVALLVDEGNHAAAISLEELWSRLQRTRPFTLLHAYPINRLGGEASSALVEQICAAHSHVVPAESYSALPIPDDRLRAVVMLQQRARWLDAEIAERKRAEERLHAALASAQADRAVAEASLA